MKKIETQRLVLREFIKSDFDDFYEYGKDKKVGPNAGWAPHESEEESRKIFKSFQNSEEVFAIYHKADEKVIGAVGFDPDRKRTIKNAFSIGYVLNSKYWGRGIMPEAAIEVIKFLFTEKDAFIVAVYHYPFNKRSKRVIEKLGFTYEGIIRYSTKIYDGSIHDDLCYSMTKEEFNRLFNQCN
ncbi:MAG: GNAT family N-acetyltransferase [Clostridia bacterium]